MALERLRAQDLARWVATYADALERHRDALDRLNVFPVPDADTGTNMVATASAARRAVAEVAAAGGPDPGATGAAVCDALGEGALRGAQGNSGVILCQLLRALAAELGPVLDAGAGGASVAAALGRASVAADEAVGDPREGTILSVARAAAGGAATGGDGLLGVLERARAAAAEALARTPEQLPALQGRVDAGGAGFLLLLDAALAVADGRAVPPPPDPPPSAAPAGAPAQVHACAAGGGRYEVSFLLAVADEGLGAVRGALGAIGDSVVVVGGGGTATCHVHTDAVGAALDAALAHGRPSRVSVVDLAPPSSPPVVVVVAPGADVQGALLAALEAQPEEQVVVVVEPRLAGVARRVARAAGKQAEVREAP